MKNRQGRKRRGKSEPASQLGFASNDQRVDDATKRQNAQQQHPGTASGFVDRHLFRMTDPEFIAELLDLYLRFAKACIRGLAIELDGLDFIAFQNERADSFERFGGQFFQGAGSLMGLGVSRHLACEYW